jgi:PAS domain S-box-containing protein
LSTSFLADLIPGPFPQLLLDHLEAAIYTCDADGYITHYNKAAVSLWGRAPEPGKDRWSGSWKMYEPDGITPISPAECPMAITLKEGRPVNGRPFIIEKPNGERNQVIPYPRLFFDDQGKLVGSVNLLLDVSLTISPLRDHRESSAGESEERYRLAVETANLGTWSFDPVSMEIYCSSEVLRAYNLPAGTPLDYATMSNMVHPDDLDLVRSRLAKAFDPANNGDYDVEHRIITFGSNAIRWTRVRGKMYFNADGQPEKLIGTLLDITDEKRAKEQLEKLVEERTLDLRKMNEQLRRSNHDLEQFAYIASHDLQEPLRKIQSFIDIARQKEDKKNLPHYFEKIVQSARRMSMLIKDVLNYSRLDSDEMLFTEVSLNQVLKEVAMDYEHLIVDKRALIKSSDLPVINGIYAQIRQLFANLLSNALKFSSANPEISIVARPLPPNQMNDYPATEKGKQYVELTFSDNGIGFDQQYADRVFMIFQRLHSKTEYSGTGIGLALCKKIVENHQGYIKAESIPDNGSVFTVILPA